MSKAFAAIPEPMPTMESMLNTVQALKQTVELLTGQRGNVAPTRVFVQNGKPTPERVGDIWVNTSATNKVLVWDGTDWRIVTV